MANNRFQLEFLPNNVLQIVIDLIEAYDEGYGEFKNDDKKWDQRALYWRCGFGLVEKHLSYFVAMAFNEQKDFFGVMEGRKKVTRSTAVKVSNCLMRLISKPVA